MRRRWSEEEQLPFPMTVLPLQMTGPTAGGVLDDALAQLAERASTSGELSSMRRPSGATMRSITPMTAASDEKVLSERNSLPLRSM